MSTACIGDSRQSNATRPAIIVAVCALMLAVAGCANSRPVTGALEVSAEPAPGASTHQLLIATTRARDETPATFFSGERQGALDFARIAISVPPVHEPGQIEWPRDPPGDPERHFVTRDAAYLDDEDRFTQSIRDALAGSASRDVLIFVHGFNTLFAEGVYRFAQIVHDTGFDGVPVLFTWASRGKVIDYVYDRDSATAARDALERTIHLAAKAGAGNVHIMAHSMGNWVTMEALRQARIAGDGDFGGRLGEVILASPDIDVDVFTSQMRRLGSPARPYYMLVSTDDRALKASSVIAGNRPRVGSYANDREIAELGVVVIDLTEVESPDSLHHGKFADSAEIVQLIGRRLGAGNRLTAVEDRDRVDLERFGRNLGGLVGATADVVITVPRAVLSTPR